MNYIIKVGSKNGYKPRGAARDFLHYQGEAVIAGPAETGKTLAACAKMNMLALKYPKSQLAIVRKTFRSMPGTVLQTFEKIRDKSVKILGGTKPERYLYPNGSVIWLGGMDNPSKVLSSERDVIYVNQAEELNLAEWETLSTRATGRAGNMPYAQMIGDCNPSGRKHWILEREKEQKLKLFESRHQDNPVLYDDDGDLTEQGIKTLKILDSLTGVRYARLRLGQWVSAEGQIYSQFDPAVHVVDNFEIPDNWRKIRVIDFGLVHPFVCLWIAIDPDKRMYVYRQIYMTGRTVATHSIKIKDLSANEKISQTICDHDAEDRMTLAENGIPNIQAKKAVLQGIGRVQERLKIQLDDKPRLFILKHTLVEVDQTLKIERKPTELVQEFGDYIWSNRATKEMPVKDYDHAMDALRYGVMYFDEKRPIQALAYGRAGGF